MGDVIVMGDRGYQLLVDPVVVPRILNVFAQIEGCKIKSVPVQCRKISLSELASKGPSIKEAIHGYFILLKTLQYFHILLLLTMHTCCAYLRIS